jgi:PAS domain S-box-containing protein
LTLVAQATSLPELLAVLHGRALCVARGQCALLFERNASTGSLLAISASGLDRWSTESWTPAGPEANRLSSAVSRSTPTLVTRGSGRTPELLERLGTRAAWLQPLHQRGEPVGILAIGWDGRTQGAEREGTATAPDLREVADAASTALELFRLRQDDRLQRSLRTVLDQNTFDSIAHLVVVVDRRNRIVHANHAFARRVGMAHDALIERPLQELVGVELGTWLSIQASEQADDDEPPVSHEVVDPVLNGPFMVTVTALRSHEGERVGSLMVARDLAAQAKMHEEREELRRRLLQSEKLAALGQFVAGIAHELNNPLQGVLGHLELLRVTGAFPTKLRRDIQTIYREADRAAKIVRNLLAFSGSRRLSRRAVSVNAVLQKVLVVRASACRAADIEVVRHYDDQLPRVQCDPLLLHQVFLNLLVNAEHSIAATGRKGRIELTTAAAEGNRVIVSVRDTGGGIAADVVSRIFEPFYTTKEVGQGSGLGLAISYGIVQEHGGEIVAANHPDGGAVFTIELPARAVPREQADATVSVRAS